MHIYIYIYITTYKMICAFIKFYHATELYTFNSCPNERYEIWTSYCAVHTEKYWCKVLKLPLYFWWKMKLSEGNGLCFQEPPLFCLSSPVIIITRKEPLLKGLLHVSLSYISTHHEMTSFIALSYIILNAALLSFWKDVGGGSFCFALPSCFLQPHSQMWHPSDPLI